MAQLVRKGASTKTPRPKSKRQEEYDEEDYEEGEEDEEVDEESDEDSDEPGGSDEENSDEEAEDSADSEESEDDEDDDEDEEPARPKYNAKKTQKAVGNVSRRAYQASQQGAQKAKAAAKQIKRDMQENISDTMMATGRYGVAIYVYAFLGYALFFVSNTTAILLLLAWVILCERNKFLMRVILNILAIYLLLNGAHSVLNLIFDIVQDLLPNWSFMYVLHDLVSKADDIETYIYKLAEIFIAIKGITGARKGKYIKVGYIEDLFKD